MKKAIVLLLLILGLLLLVGCEKEGIIGSADGPTAIIVADGINDIKPEHKNPTSSSSVIPNQAIVSEPAIEPEFIGKERAKEIALEKVGLAESEVRFEKIELDFDDGVWKYEIELRDTKYEYEAEVNAVEGTIISWDVEPID